MDHARILPVRTYISVGISIDLMASLSSFSIWRTDYRSDKELIEYISEVSDIPVDIATVQQGLIQAKKQLGFSDHSSRSKKKNTEAGYSMSVAEQLVVFTEKLLQDDRSTSAGTGHVLV